MIAVDETEEQILSRHEKENRDLIATVTGLKKQATKSKRKEVNKKCLELELNMKEKHERELKVCRMIS
jgi:OTU domain-containing protein 6